MNEKRCLTAKEKASYGVGAVGKDMVYMLSASYIQYYYYDLVPNRKHHITYESMVEDYLPNGINKFKISGRNDNVINVIERYAEYFPRDEYRDQVRNHLLIDFFNNRPN